MSCLCCSNSSGQVIVHSVGDGNAIELSNGATGNSALVDCGGDNAKAIPVLLGASIRGATDFVLTHFHYDHYSGVSEQPVGTVLARDIDAIYVPALPLILDYKTTLDFAVALFALNKVIFGSMSEVAEKDLIDKFQNLNPSGMKPTLTFLSKGDSFNVAGTDFEVLWPPKYLNSSGIVKSVVEAVKAFDRAVEIDPRVRRALDEVRKWAEQTTQLAAERAKLDEGRSAKEEENIRSTLESDDNFSVQEEPEDNSDLPTVIKEANKKIRGVANRLSLAFRSPGCFLHLGDLEDNEINVVAKDLYPKPYFCNVVAAHHGTHFGHKLAGITMCSLLVSNGTQRPQIDVRYRKISGRIQETNINGTSIGYFC